MWLFLAALAFHYYKSGLGSGGLVNTRYVVGILDALIVPEEYREQVLATDPGMCDRYLFGDGKKTGESILSCFSRG